jgi:hypothetical protein
MTSNRSNVTMIQMNAIGFGIKFVYSRFTITLSNLGIIVNNLEK